MLEQTKQQMASLRLNGMLMALEEQLNGPPVELSFEERLGILVSREHCERENQRLKNRLKRAKLKPGTLEQIDYFAHRGLNKQKILNFNGSSWIQHHRNVLITGPTGTGKTFLACALAHKACLLGFSVQYYRLLHLIHDLTLAYREGRLQKVLANMNKIQVLLIDDFGMMLMEDEHKRLLFELLEYRYETTSTIITSQLPIGQWYEHIDDPIIADAILDRIVHGAEKIELQGESLRKVKNNTNENDAKACEKKDIIA